MDDIGRQEHPSHPLIRIITFGEFAIERLVPSSALSSYPARYARMSWEEWGNRGPAMTLLKVLLCSEGRRASRADLVRAIWSEPARINAGHALDSAASVLRRHVLRTRDEDALLLTIRGDSEISFRLSAQHRIWVDADAFLSLAAQAIRYEAQGENPLPFLEQAHALVQGQFLENDLHYKWSQGRRNTINGASRRVLYKLVDLYLRDRRVDLAEEMLFAFLEEHPTDEDALYRLMLLLAERERRQEALNLYQYVVDVLREEQIEPAPYTRELVRRIQHGLTLHERHTSYNYPLTIRKLFLTVNVLPRMRLLTRRRHTMASCNERYVHIVVIHLSA